jgi:RHS repeat-associated protein
LQSNASREQERIRHGSGLRARNVTSQSIQIGGTTYTQNYTYDNWNRLLSATEGANWTQNYGMDRYGNRAVTGGSDYKPQPGLTPISTAAFSPTTNRITLAGYTYDAAGNMTNETSSRTMTYDAENRQATFNGGFGTYNYYYDGDGRRVKATGGGVTTLFVYDPLGKLAAEYSTNPSGPQLNGTRYLTTDHLGSTRLVTDAGKAVVMRRDYLPFGEEIGSDKGNRITIAGYGAIPSLRQKFTSKERDTESNLDYFLARYHSGAQGRFTSPDPENAGATPDDPQSWNAYAYARNSPLVFSDPTGERYQRCIGQGDQQKCTEVSDADWDNYTHSNSRELIFQGGKIFARDKKGNQGTQVGTFRQVDVDLQDSAVQVAKGVIERTGTAEQLAGALIRQTAENVVYAATGAVILRGLGYGAQAIAQLNIFKNTPVIIKWSHQIMKVRPGHLPPPDSAAQIQGAVEGAIRTGNYAIKTNGIFEGTTTIQGVAVGFRGRMIDGVAHVSSVFAKK